MSTQIVSISSNLPFDEQQERDIIDYIQKLKDSHKVGQFLAALIRIAFDNPEILEKSTGQIYEGPAIKKVIDLGISMDRYQFMKSVAKEVSDMKVKVDKIYEMVLKTYELGLMGNRLGLEDKSKNDVLASFIVQKQLKDLQDSLGIQLTSSVFASNKAKDLDEFAKEALEYIINSYSNIVSELKNLTNVQPVVVQQQSQENSSGSNVNSNSSVSSQNTTQSSNTEDKDIIDFGTVNKESFDQNANTGMLTNFFGGM